MSLIDEIIKDENTNVDIYQNAPLSTLSDEQNEEMLQERLNKCNAKRLELEKLLNMANADIERLEKENTSLAETIKQIKLESSDTKLRALISKLVDKAKEFKVQSPIVRK